MAPSALTRVINGEIPAAIVRQDAHTIAFMDAGQINPGHAIVVTNKQVETIVDLDEALAGAVFRTAWRIAKAVDRAFQPDGITILQADERAGWQTVHHVRLHVLPRHAGDGVGLAGRASIRR